VFPAAILITSIIVAAAHTTMIEHGFSRNSTKANAELSAIEATPNCPAHPARRICAICSGLAIDNRHVKGRGNRLKWPSSCLTAAFACLWAWPTWMRASAGHHHSTATPAARRRPVYNRRQFSHAPLEARLEGITPLNRKRRPRCSVIEYAVDAARHGI